MRERHTKEKKLKYRRENNKRKKKIQQRKDIEYQERDNENNFERKKVINERKRTKKYQAEEKYSNKEMFTRIKKGQSRLLSMVYIKSKPLYLSFKSTESHSL